MFVVSKIDILHKLKNPFTIEPFERQVFHQFNIEEASGEVELYKFHKGADEDFNIIATKPEMKYCEENKDLIKRGRRKAKLKEYELCRSDISI